MAIYWLFVVISVVAGCLAVLYLPISGKERIKRWLAVEILGALAAALVMWCLLQFRNNPAWRRKYAELKERVHGKKRYAGT